MFTNQLPAYVRMPEDFQVSEMRYVPGLLQSVTQELRDVTKMIEIGWDQLRPEEQIKVVQTLADAVRCAEERMAGFSVAVGQDANSLPTRGAMWG